MTVQLLRRKFTVEQYHKMLDSGILTADDRVELIRGEIIEMSPIGTKHAACVNRLINLLVQLLGKRVIVAAQNPIRLNDNSQPQPDVALLKPRDDFYATAHPQPQDIFLLIEVADSTIEYDREEKIPLYAEANIIEVWLVDINEQIVEVYQQPTAAGYQFMQKFASGQTLSIPGLSDVNISVNEILC
ncbi:Uma2 family endonuclease [Calothrix sp. FACHB-1219]|uniref:Uma2 family endonuclease n=1 Tax=unclassified Calothrix TaxID=2619626 RepID=UPI00168693D4|nr:MULTISPECIES: Uma2 family endonuclease [unclassified Calothrix]MBD2208027.1 Uma2 family endonuclease [Calothrix sp. FACHB-168]MBD2222231.1 Uma2 family endonuclease [Calothrix sp. FACHB-1219]